MRANLAAGVIAGIVAIVIAIGIVGYVGLLASPDRPQVEAGEFGPNRQP